MATIRRHFAEASGTAAFTCGSCGFRGMGKASGRSAHGGRETRADAIESARHAVADAIALAPCPRCGRRSSAQIERVRREARRNGLGAAATTAFVLVGFSVLAAPDYLTVAAVAAAVVAPCMYMFVAIHRAGEREAQGNRAVIVAMPAPTVSAAFALPPGERPAEPATPKSGSGSV